MPTHKVDELSTTRLVVIPRAGKYRVWVRYVDHRKKTEPFRVTLEQGGKAVLIRQDADFPWSGKIAIAVDPEAPAEFTLKREK